MAGLVNRHTSHILPLKASSIFAEVNGFAARLLATLTYYNDCEYDIEGLFVFPQDERTTIVEFEATIEERHVSGEIREKTSIDVSKSAYAIEEREDELFSLSIGRIPPLSSVFVQVGLILELLSDQKTGGSLFVLPSVFTPRVYDKDEDENRQYDMYGSQMLISDLPRKTHELYSFDLQLEVVAPCLLAGCSSRTHAIQVDADSRAVNASRIHITIAEPHTYDRELEVLLHLSHPFDPYVLIEEGKKILIRSEPNENLQRFSLPRDEMLENLTEKPAIMVNFSPQLKTFTKSCSEFIFLVDRSGSMSGKHIFQVKEALILFLKSLPTNSYFNIVGFGSYYRCLFQESRQDTEENLEKAMNYVNKMRADLGGTNLILPLEFIFEQPNKRGRPRIIFLLTDGGVSNTLDVVDAVRKNSHTCRFYTFGIGPEACPHLVQGVAGPSGGKSLFITEDERIPPKVIEALDAALRPAITDVEVSWHLPEGYDIIQSPSKVPFIFDSERLVMYGILSRPLNEEKESPRTPQKRRMDSMMRSFSNNSVKVFWFDDDMEYLPEEQLLLELEEQERLVSQESIAEVTMEQPPVVRLRTASEINKRNPESVGGSSEEFPKIDMDSANVAETSEEIGKTSKQVGRKSSKPANLLDVTVDDSTSNHPTPNSSPKCGTFDDITHDIFFGSFFKSCEMIDGLDYTRNDVQPIQCPSLNPEQISQLKRYRFASERNLSHHYTDTNSLDKSAKDETTSQRYYERDSGVGFSMDDADVSETDNNIKPGTKAPPNSAASSCDVLLKASEPTRINVFKNSELLGNIGVPKNFAAVGIKGFVGDEEIEQVIPYPINRSNGSSKRPTIHQLLARSLIRDFTVSEDLSQESMRRICTIAKQNKIHCRLTAFTSVDQYCYENEITSALQFASKEDPAVENQRKVLTLERKGGFTTGLGRRLPTPEGSDQDSIEELAEHCMGDSEEPTDLYRLDRTPTIESSDSSPAKSGTNSPRNKTNYAGRPIPPLSTRYVVGEKRSQQPMGPITTTYSGRISPVLTSPPKEFQPYVYLAKLQSRSGYWELNVQFAECIGLPLYNIQQASPLADSSMYISFSKELEEIMKRYKCEYSSQLWATALALSWLCRYHNDNKNEWFLLARKADKWLAECDYPCGFTCADLKKLAYQALLLMRKAANPMSESPLEKKLIIHTRRQRFMSV